jgi:excisionase family DNA binding protein
MSQPDTLPNASKEVPPGDSAISLRALRAQILGEDYLLTIGEVAAIVGISKRQIYHLIHRRTFPTPRKLGALSRWRLGTIREWIRIGPKIC